MGISNISRNIINTWLSDIMVYICLCIYIYEDFLKVVSDCFYLFNSKSPAQIRRNFGDANALTDG